MTYYFDDIDSELSAAEPPKWSMRRTVAFVGVTNISLWIALIWAAGKLVALA